MDISKYDDRRKKRTFINIYTNEVVEILCFDTTNVSNNNQKMIVYSSFNADKFVMEKTEFYNKFQQYNEEIHLKNLFEIHSGGKLIMRIISPSAIKGRLTVKEFIKETYGDCTGKTIHYKSQEGDGDSAFKPYEEFIEKYGDRLMGSDFQNDFCHNDFCHADGERDLNQFIKRVF